MLSHDIDTSASETLERLTQHLWAEISLKKGAPFFLALSGGDTAQQLFRFWSARYARQIPWQDIRFFWVDERCVPPDHPESNYGWAKKLLFAPLHIDTDGARAAVFRIAGEYPPHSEAERYSGLIRSLLPHADGAPRFDAAILGVGADAHTASIFPADTSLLSATEPYRVSQHPNTGQQRITATGPLLLNASVLLVPVLGAAKRDVVQGLLDGSLSHTPAGYLLSRAKKSFLYTDF